MSKKINKTNNEAMSGNQAVNNTTSLIEENNSNQEINSKIETPDLQNASMQITNNSKIKDKSSLFKKQSHKKNKNERDAKSKVIPKKTIITIVIILLLLLLIMSITLGVLLPQNKNKEFVIKFYSDSIEITELKQKVVNGKSIAIPAIIPIKESDSAYSYVFDNWYTDESFTQAFDFSSPITGNLTLYAKFNAIANEYTVSFVTNNGSSIAPIGLNYGDTVTKPVDPTKDSTAQYAYFFDNWYTDESFTQAFDFSSPITGNLTLYAKFNAIVNTYTVSFVTDRGSDDLILAYGSKINQPSDPPTNLDNALYIAHTFIGWFTEPTGGEKFDFDSSSVKGNITLYAQYSIEDLLLYEKLVNGNYKVTGINAKANKATLSNIVIPTDTSTLVSENVTDKDALIVEVEKGILLGCDALTEITIPFVGATLDGSISPLFGYLFGANEYIDHETVLPTALKTVNVTDGEIWGDSFSNILSIETVILPNDIEYIGLAAFGETASLKNIVIPDSVKTIEELAFFGAKALTHINIPESVQVIGAQSFEQCTNLETVTIFSDIVNIGVSAFWHCPALKSVSISGKVTEIGKTAFYECTALETFYVGGGIDIIGEQAFCLCSSLTDFSFENGVSEIAFGAFNYCHKLSVTLPNNLEKIGANAFGGCDSIVTLIIPDSVTSIGQSAFAYCDALTSVTIPNSIATIEFMTFSNCIKLNNIVIENGVSKIGNSVFADCISLSEITIPSSVTSIGSYAFSGCKALQTIALPNELLTISSLAFNGCEALKAIALPSGLTSIGDEVFYGCSTLPIINIPASVTSIGNGIVNHCSALNSIVVDSANTTYRSEGDCLIERATNTIIAGCKASIIPNNVSIIGYWAFRHCNELTTISIPDSVTTIGKSAFHECNALVSVTGMKSVKTIDDQAFEKCIALKNIDTNNKLVNINEKAFNECVSLESINLPDSLNVIGKFAFNNCDSLTEITIPGSVNVISNSAFAFCDKLKTVIIKNGVYQISKFAFYSLTNATIYIPASVSIIEEYVFDHCIDSVIRCEVSEPPSGWNPKWRDSFYGTVYWGAAMPTDFFDIK